MSAQNIQVENRNNGIKKEGKLEEIVNFSKKLEDVLEEVCDDEEPVENFDFWKPKNGDDEGDIRNRTATLASTCKKEAEIEDKRNDCSEDGVIPSVKKAFKPLASVSLKIVRETEEMIYSFMLYFNPYYFDAEKFSISLEKNGDKFEINFKSPEEEYRRAVKERFDSKE